MFGTLNAQGQKEAFDLYSMRQAIEEGFILDVTSNYTTYDSFCKVVKSIPDDPELESAAAKRQLAHLIATNDGTVMGNLRVIVDHFASKVQGDLGGRAKAMIVTSSREAAVRYRMAYEELRRENMGKLGHAQALVAFSGEVIVDGEKYTESGMNGGLAEEKLPELFRKDGYRILIVADKYQTGFDEPLLHTMYVDKKLMDVTAVQTLSRLNRTYPGKNSTFVLDFENSGDDIRNAFLPYYETTILEGSTDLNKVYDLRNKVRNYMLYSYDDVDAFNKFMTAQRGKKQDPAALGKLTAMFRPVIARYQELSEEDRFTARDYVRKFNGAYSYITQLVRLHDKDLFNEYQYTMHLARLLPRPNDDDFVDIEDKVKLEYAKLNETFKGAIVLDEKPVILTPSNNIDPKLPNKKKDTLQSIIDKVNERFSGNFTDSDRVIIEGIYQMFMKDSDVKKFKKYAKDNSTEMFVQSLFPDKFRDIVTQCFLDNNDSFAKLFNDPEFYQKVQDAMAAELYTALRKDKE